jgi:DNA-directed RNA polymerase subunit RPC12/RpoP
MLWTIVRVIIAVAGALAIYVFLAATIRKFKVPPPPEPDPDDTRPVDLHYRCIVCGAEVTMTAVPSITEDLPEPPRHCREDMVLT